MRFDKPVGTVLLFWPVCWAWLLAYEPLPPWPIVLVFTLGVILTRAAGCIINDYADRHIDNHVARTQTRPLVTGAVSPRGALVCLCILGILLVALLPFLNETNRWLALCAVLLTICYPLTKRFFAFPQFVLGITFNLGVMMVFVEAGKLSVAAYALYAASIAWTFAYDTVYALADINDDTRIGIQSSARTLGKHVALAIGISYGVMATYLGTAIQHAWIGLLIGTLIVPIYLSIHPWVLRKPITFFKANAWFGAGIALLFIDGFLGSNVLVLSVHHSW